MAFGTGTRTTRGVRCRVLGEEREGDSFGVLKSSIFRDFGSADGISADPRGTVPQIGATSSDESLPVADLYAEDVLNKLAGLLNLWHSQRKINLFALASPDDNAG